MKLFLSFALSAVCVTGMFFLGACERQEYIPKPSPDTYQAEPEPEPEAGAVEGDDSQEAEGRRFLN